MDPDFQPPHPPSLVDRPRSVPADSAMRWGWDALALMFRASSPLVLIALGIGTMDLFVHWASDLLPQARAGLIGLSMTTSPLWAAAALVTLRWSDLGRVALKVTLPRLKVVVAGLMVYLVPALGVAMWLSRRGPNGVLAWEYSTVSWSLLVMVGVMAWTNFVGTAMLVAYHQKSQRVGLAAGRAGWRRSGATAIVASSVISMLAWCGAASTPPAPMEVFSAAFLALTLLAVLYAGYVDIFEQRRAGARPG